jgi:hypothetical protein
MAGDPVADLYEPAPSVPDMLAPFRPYDPLSDRTAIGAFGRSAARSTLPTAGGVAAFPLGAGVMGAAISPIAAMTGPAAPVVEGVGAAAGGLLASFGMGYLVDEAQQKMLGLLPDSITTFIGQDRKSQQADAFYHPYATFAGGVAPQIAFMRPGWSGMRTAMVGAGIGGGVEAGSEYAQDGRIDPIKVGAQAVIGGALGKNTRLGDATMAPAQWAVDRLPTGAGITQAAQGARDTIQSTLSTIGDAAATAREATLAKIFPLVPKAVRDRWLAAGTMDDVIAGQHVQDHIGADHLTPDEKSAIHVANDAALTAATSPFQMGPAGDQEHGLRLSATMQAILAGEPLPPIGQAASGAGTRAALLNGASHFSGVDGVTSRIIGAESGGNAGIRNPFPGQTAAGLGQFTDQTWLGMMHQNGAALGHADLAAQISRQNGQWTVADPPARARIIGLKRDGGTAGPMTQLAVKNYVADLRGVNLPVTDGNIYLMHFLGPKTAKDVLHADPATPIAALVPDSWIKVNPALQGKTAGQVVAWTDQRMGGAGIPAPGSGEFADLVAQATSAEGFDPAPYMDQMRAYVADGRKPLAGPDVASALGLDNIAQGNRMLSALASSADGGIRLIGKPIETDANGEIVSHGDDMSSRYVRQAQRRGPIDALTFLADRGGLADNEGHGLVNQRNLQSFIPGAGNLIRPNGLSIDRAGEMLWDHGYFGPPSATPRPTPAQVLDYFEQAARDKAFPPEQQVAKAEAKRKLASDDAEQQASDQLDGAIGEYRSLGMDINLSPAERAFAMRDMAHGNEAHQALENALYTSREHIAAALGVETNDVRYAKPASNGEDYADAVPGFDEGQSTATAHRIDGDGHGGRAGPSGNAGGSRADAREFDGPARLPQSATGDARSLEPFDDPAGEGARAQAQSIEHDLRMELEAAVDPAIADRQREQTKLGSKSPKRGAAEQESTMGLGLFDTADQPEFRLDAGGGDHSLADVLKSADDEEAGAVRLRACLPPAGGEA